MEGKEIISKCLRINLRLYINKKSWSLLNYQLIESIDKGNY